MYGQITSPGYPLNYPNNANYTWIIKTGHQKAEVEIKIEFMDIKKWSPCDDYLLVRRLTVKYKSSSYYAVTINVQLINVRNYVSSLSLSPSLSLSLSLSLNRFFSSIVRR